MVSTKLLLSLVLSLVAAKQAKAQCDFTFCRRLSNIPDLSVITNPEDPVAEQKSCATLYDEVAAGMYDNLQCEKKVKLLENICCPASATRECFVCGDSDAAFNVQKAFAPVPGVDTCGTVDRQLKILPAGEACDQAKAAIPVNLSSFCECPGTEEPYTCKLCWNDRTVNLTATFADWDDGRTCGQTYEVSKHVNNDTFCAEMTSVGIRKACCVNDQKSSGSSLSIRGLATTLIVGLALALN